MNLKMNLAMKMNSLVRIRNVFQYPGNAMVLMIVGTTVTKYQDTVHPNNFCFPTLEMLVVVFALSMIRILLDNMKNEQGLHEIQTRKKEK